jgi:histone acetyltransferase SAS2
LFAKLFLDSKSLYFALDGFEFFVLYDVESSIPLGFFSREKNSWDKYNLACILVFPPFQGLGLGQLLIGFSYELSKSENQIGSPEKPLSMYGHKSYLAYWTKTIARILLTYKQKVVSIKELSKESAIRPEDIEEALKSMNALQYDKNNNPLISLLKVNQWATSINLSLDPVIDPSCCYIPPLENNKSS